MTVAASFMLTLARLRAALLAREAEQNSAYRFTPKREQCAALGSRIARHYG
jgi:hypothetical protein